MDPKEAAKRAVEFLQQHPISEERALTKEVLVRTGLHYWNYTYKGTTPGESTDVEANDNLKKRIIELCRTDPYVAVKLSKLLHIPDSMISLMGASRWVDQGLPLIRFGHKRLAALMATSISKDNLSHVKAPWKAFYIELPPDLISLTSDQGHIPIKGVLVHTVFHAEATETIPRGTAWNWIAITNSELTMWMVNTQPSMLVGLEDPGSYWEDVCLPYESHDQRVQVLIGRLICATCLMMSSPENFKERIEPPLPKKGSQRKKTPSDPPRFRVFTETQKVDVDARPAISGYLQGSRGTRVPSARVLVTGHFRRQPYGLNSSLRKVIWIEPYWTHGPDTAPIKPRVYEAE